MNMSRPKDNHLSRQDAMMSASPDNDPNLIIIIDDQTLIRHCLEICLRSSYEGAAVLSFVNMVEFLNAKPDATKIALVLYGIHHRNVSDPEVEQGLCEARQAFPTVPIVLLSEGERADQIIEALAQGARGYVPTNASLDVLVGATQLVLAGGTFVPATSFVDTVAHDARKSLAAARFTPRQLEVLECVRRGKANRMIAHELQMSEGTVKAHVCNLMRKLKATNRTQLVFLTKDLFAAGDGACLPTLASRNVPVIAE